MGRFFSDDQRDEMRERQGNRCNRCGCPLGSGGEANHEIPYSTSQWTDTFNGSMVCSSCHRDMTREQAETGWWKKGKSHSEEADEFYGNREWD